jgi:hypothetical protein
VFADKSIRNNRTDDLLPIVIICTTFDLRQKVPFQEAG